MNLKRYFIRKPIEDLLNEAKSSHDLERTLGAFQLVMLGLGAIIGAGIFVLAGSAAALHAGPAIVLSFALAGLACACAGLCYAELSSMIPISGSAYTFTYATLGEFTAWIVAGMIMLICLFGAGAVAIGWSGYLVSLLADYGIYIPAQFATSFGQVSTLADGSTVTGICNLPAIFIIATLTMVVYRGAEAAALLNTIIVAMKMTALFMFIFIGIAHVQPDNWIPFIPENTGVRGEFGISGIIAGAGAVLLAFSGFDVVASAAQEAKNPKRDLPIGILGSLAISTIVYILIAAVLTGIVKYDLLNVQQPMALAVEKMQLPWFSLVIKLGAITGLSSVILALIYAAVRILFTVTNDGLLPEKLATCHKKFHTPYILTIGVGIAITVLASTLDSPTLGKMSNLGIASTFSVVCYSTLFMRYKHPNLPRGFVCPLSPALPAFGILIFGSLIVSLIAPILTYATMWLTFITVIYFGYSQFNSHLSNNANNKN